MQVRTDAAGVIEVSGSTLMEGYRLDAAATGAAFTTDAWLRTGDVGAIDDDGHLSIFGRADHVIRTGAEKVWPEEVERALSSHPKVRDVAVAALESAPLQRGARERVDHVDVALAQARRDLLAEPVVVLLGDLGVDLPPPDPRLGAGLADDELVLRRAPGVGARADHERALGRDHAAQILR